MSITASTASSGPRLGKSVRLTRGARGQHVPRSHRGGLDGLRGFAVIAVILYHGGVGWAHGGFLGVEVFFVLSGYLITSLLIGEWLQSGRINLGAFWARRARRLLPALLAMVVVVGIYYAAAGPTHAVTGLWGDGLATLLYYGNWHEIADSTNYFVGGGPVSPFLHTWSLAIEEQFYAVWPMLVLGVLWITGRTGARLASTSVRLRVLLAFTLTGAVASALETALLFDSGRGLDRVYYGTDTRSSGLLFGAALAVGLALRHLTADTNGSHARRSGRQMARMRRAVMRIASAGALVGLLAEMYVASGSSGWLFPYGLVLVDMAVAVVIAAVVLVPGSMADRILSVSPLRATGQISYGLYLWHFPLFLWLSVSATGVGGARLLLLRVGVTLVVSVLSHVLIEQPVRERRRPAWLAYGLVSLGGLAPIAVLFAASAAGASSTGVVVTASVPSGLAGTQPACTVSLRDTSQYGEAPIASTQLTSFETLSLGRHPILWRGSADKTYHTCQPKRLLLIGDSIAFALGTPMLNGEQQYGVEIANAAKIGCAFSTRGQVIGVNGTSAAPDNGCGDALSTWVADERRFRPVEVMIELGYRDEFDWRWHGRVVHLGVPRFDTYVQAQIDGYVKALGHYHTKILFLSVPYTNPPAQANGAPSPAASPARHTIINTMIVRAVRRDQGNAAVVDIDRTISPGNHFDATVDGEPCRLDGIHPNVFCSQLLEPHILSEARALIKRARQ